MKILHTADWHLGQKFMHYDRKHEHQEALDWLVQLIESEAIDVLIVAGDVFDTMNPPNYARKMYFDFLKNLFKTPCRHIVIIGGNHDSPSMLNAPKDLLKALNVHIVGSATADIEEEVIELRDRAGELEAVVGAIPFLRDQDLRVSIAGETGQEREDRIKSGIRAHYEAVAQIMEQYESDDVPLIATGHLYASGAEAADKQNNIYIGNIENIEAESFPSVFDYIALGHIHKPQIVGGEYHIHYSGSLIPLSFVEAKKDEKVVKIITFEGRKMASGVREVSVPLFRQLRTVKGDLKAVKKELKALSQHREPLVTWIEAIVETDELIPNLDALLRDFSKDMPIELLKVRTANNYYALNEQIETVDLDDLEPLDVFVKKCESNGRPPEEMEELKGTFLELMDWMRDKDV